MKVNPYRLVLGFVFVFFFGKYYNKIDSFTDKCADKIIDFVKRKIGKK